MLRILHVLVLTALVSPAPTRVPPAELAPFLKAITASAGAPGRIACRDIDMALQLKRDGLSPDASAPVAWASSEAHLRSYLADGKLVVTGDAALLEAGAGLAVVKDKGKPVILISTQNIAASGITLSDALLKIARRS